MAYAETKTDEGLVTMGLSRRDRFLKRSFDIVVALLGLLATFWLIALAWVIASIDTRSNGLFCQTRVGQHGRLFKVMKIKSMRVDSSYQTTATRAGDPRITRSGAWLRKTKIDELPQLWNVLVGDMSLVGPRPDVPGYADQLTGRERLILSVRPGITGPATLAYRDEETLLAKQPDPETYNNDVIYPHKIKLNLKYIEQWSFLRDLSYLLQTLK